MTDAALKRLLRIQKQFHEVIMRRAADLIREHKTPLPELAGLVSAPERKGWFSVPGMYGGFNYWLQGEGEATKLVCESWCRVVGGSGQRHEITESGAKLLEEGFV